MQEIGETASLAALKRAVEVEPLVRPATIAENLDGSGAGASGRTSAVFTIRVSPGSRTAFYRSPELRISRTT